ncbi:unnamed protein product [Protopolystoma xenopodis]|uniref:NR LBD domain-containing protein n=1 Tax=Protopolystoma xenopodis TaxID=117903 RepID=A0A3S5AQU4_9PLAT|nr:unnamed protein product [Protopolystoma xenopodis]
MSHSSTSYLSQGRQNILEPRPRSRTLQSSTSLDSTVAIASGNQPIDSAEALEISCLMSQLTWRLLGEPAASEVRHRLDYLVERFMALRLDGDEFACLKFLVLFNPGKHGQC